MDTIKAMAVINHECINMTCNTVEAEEKVGKALSAINEEHTKMLDLLNKLTEALGSATKSTALNLIYHDAKEFLKQKNKYGLTIHTRDR